MHSFPKITVVTPNYNYGQFLESTILSVISQGYPNLEYIIIDGGSTDNSLAIIKKYEHHLTYWCTEKDAGMYDAINKGFKRSTGDIMAWINSDDIYFPWALRTVADIFMRFQHVNWVSSLQPGLMDYDGQILNFSFFPAFSRSAFKDGMHMSGKWSLGAIQQESTFWRRSLWQNAGSYVSNEYSMASDYELWARFYAVDQLYGVISPLGCYRFQESQKTQQGTTYNTESNNIHNKHYAPPSTLSKVRKTIRQLGLQKIPFCGRLLRGSVGYEGRVITKALANSRNTKWEEIAIKYL